MRKITIGIHKQISCERSIYLKKFKKEKIVSENMAKIIILGNLTFSQL